MSCSEIAPRCVPGGWGLQCRGSRGPGPQDKNLDSLLRVQRSVWCLASKCWDQSPGHWPWGSQHSHHPQPCVPTGKLLPSTQSKPACQQYPGRVRNSTDKSEPSVSPATCTGSHRCHLPSANSGWSTSFVGVGNTGDLEPEAPGSWIWIAY